MTYQTIDGEVMTDEEMNNYLVSFDLDAGRGMPARLTLRVYAANERMAIALAAQNAREVFLEDRVCLTRVPFVLQDPEPLSVAGHGPESTS